jgi:quinol monooxygenase YgiN
MILRIVQMTFREDKVAEFLELFDERKDLIRAFKGCARLELWEDTGHSTIMFTYSLWESEEHLNHYRFSELFKDTWAKTRTLFAAKPQAWSVHQREVVG